MNDYHKIVKYLEQIAAKNLAKKGLKEIPGRLGNKATNEVAEDGKKVESFGYPSIVSLLTIFTGISTMLFYGYYMEQLYVQDNNSILLLYCLSLIFFILCLLKSPSTRPLLPCGAPHSEKEPPLMEV